MPLIEWAMRNSVSTDSPAGSSPAESAASARAISWRWSLASSTNSVLYFSRFRTASLLDLLRECLSGDLDHVVRLERLHDEVACARLERFHHQRLLAERAAHHDARARMAGDDLAQRLEPALARHHDVERHEIGVVLRERRDGLVAVRRLAHDLVAAVRQDVAEHLAHERRVVRNQNPVCHGSCPPTPC